MKNVGFHQRTILEIKLNESDNHIIKLVYRCGYPYPSCYVLKLIVGVKYRRSKKYIFKNKVDAYKALRGLVYMYTIDYINEQIELPF